LVGFLEKVINFKLGIFEISPKCFDTFSQQQREQFQQKVSKIFFFFFADAK
jgi:hypothetical protein